MHLQALDYKVQMYFILPLLPGTCTIPVKQCDHLKKGFGTFFDGCSGMV